MALVFVRKLAWYIVELSASSYVVLGSICFSSFDPVDYLDYDGVFCHYTIVATRQKIVRRSRTNSANNPKQNEIQMLLS